MEKLGLVDYTDAREINRKKFLARLSSEIGKRGVIDVLRKGVEHGPLHFDLSGGLLRNWVEARDSANFSRLRRPASDERANSRCAVAELTLMQAQLVAGSFKTSRDGKLWQVYHGLPDNKSVR